MLKAELESTVGAQHVFVFGHIPLFISQANEQPGYFNIAQPLRTDVLDMLVKNKCSHYFCGHYHRNAGGVFKADNGATCEVIVTGACGTNFSDKPGGNPVELDGIGVASIGKHISGLRLVDVDHKTVDHMWHCFNDLPTVQ